MIPVLTIYSYAALFIKFCLLELLQKRYHNACHFFCNFGFFENINIHKLPRKLRNSLIGSTLKCYKENLNLAEIEP